MTSSEPRPGDGSGSGARPEQTTAPATAAPQGEPASTPGPHTQDQAAWDAWNWQADPTADPVPASAQATAPLPVGAGAERIYPDDPADLGAGPAVAGSPPGVAAPGPGPAGIAWLGASGSPAATTGAEGAPEGTQPTELTAPLPVGAGAQQRPSPWSQPSGATAWPGAGNGGWPDGGQGGYAEPGPGGHGGPGGYGGPGQLYGFGGSTAVTAPSRGRGPGWAAVIGISAATGLVAALLGAGLGASLAERETSPGAVTPVARPSGSLASLASKAMPSVVTVRARNSSSGATGSGFVYDTSGHIITNNHVVDGVGSSISIRFSDGSSKDAEVVGADATYDIAVLKVDPSGLTPLPLGDSTTVVVGDEVMAMGAPLGLESTVTSGIISAVDRPVVAGDSSTRSYINALQTDAAINPGNSGGPLIDMAGAVIGVNSAIATPPGSDRSNAGSIGLGFAIPSAQVRKTADQLISTGTSQHPIIGVLLDTDYSGPGARVQAEGGSDDPVTDGGPADQAGVEPGDLIVGFDGEQITDADDLIVRIRARNVGDRVPVRLERDGRTVDVTITLQAAEK